MGGEESDHANSLASKLNNVKGRANDSSKVGGGGPGHPLRNIRGIIKDRKYIIQV